VVAGGGELASKAQMVSEMLLKKRHPSTKFMNKSTKKLRSGERYLVVKKGGLVDSPPVEMADVTKKELTSWA
jgi:hypothetical protein